jgi:hypothetical protein
MEGVESSNFDLFRDCLASPLIEKSSQDPVRKCKKGRGNGRKRVNEPVTILPQEPNDAEELAEFIDVSAMTPKLRTTRSQSNQVYCLRNLHQSSIQPPNIDLLELAR